MTEARDQDGGPRDPIFDETYPYEYEIEEEIMGYECMCCDATQENPGDCVRCCGPTAPMYF